MDEQLLRASPFGRQAGQTIDSLTGDFTGFQINKATFQVRPVQVTLSMLLLVSTQDVGIRMGLRMDSLIDDNIFVEVAVFIVVEIFTVTMIRMVSMHFRPCAAAATRSTNTTSVMLSHVMRYGLALPYHPPADDGAFYHRGDGRFLYTLVAQ